MKKKTHMRPRGNKQPPTYYFAELSLENFKVHESIENLKLKPITLLIGPNSSGKTALFQPLLVLKQSFMAKAQAVEPLSLNGDFVNLGSYADMVLARDTELPSA
jgi:predicted ATPase